LRNLTRSTLLRNKAREYVESHFSKKEARRFHDEMNMFVKRYELCWADHSQIFPDTFQALDKLRNLGCKMGIVTNTSKEAANRMLLTHGISDFFDVVVTREDVKRLKPDPEGILVALKKLAAQDFFFVGDLVHDSQAAKKAYGVAITVNRNPSNKSKFASDYAVRSLLEIPRLVQRKACASRIQGSAI